MTFVCSLNKDVSHKSNNTDHSDAHGTPMMNDKMNKTNTASNSTKTNDGSAVFGNFLNIFAATALSVVVLF